MAKQNHAHKFRRHRYSTGREVYFCALPDCTVKMIPALALGKRAVCWRCGEEFLMDDYTIRLAKPHCQKCHNPKNRLETREQTVTPQVAEVSSSSAGDLRSRMSQLFKQPALSGEASDDNEDI